MANIDITRGINGVKDRTTISILREEERVSQLEEELLSCGKSKKSREYQDAKAKHITITRVKWFWVGIQGGLPYLTDLGISYTSFNKKTHPKTAKNNGKDAKNTAPLDKDQQLALSRIVQAGIAARAVLRDHAEDEEVVIPPYLLENEIPMIDEFLDEQGISYDKLTRNQKRASFRLLEEADMARDIMIEGNCGLIKTFVGKETKKKNLSRMDLEEIHSECYYGLIKAVDKFNPDYELAFSTAAAWWIKQCVHEYLNSKSKMIKMPTSMNTLFKNIKWATDELKKKNPDKENFTEEEITECLATDGRTINKKPITLEMVKKATKMRCETSSYDQMIGDNEDFCLVNMLSSEEDVAENVVEQMNSQDVLEKMLSLISDDRNRDILREWYTDDTDEDALKVSNIARKHGLSKDRVKQIRVETEKELSKKAHENLVNADFAAMIRGTGRKVCCH